MARSASDESIATELARQAGYVNGIKAARDIVDYSHKIAPSDQTTALLHALDLLAEFERLDMAEIALATMEFAE